MCQWQMPSSAAALDQNARQVTPSPSRTIATWSSVATPALL
jgi:hypothetical protein